MFDYIGNLMVRSSKDCVHPGEISSFFEFFQYDNDHTNI